MCLGGSVTTSATNVKWAIQCNQQVQVIHTQQALEQAMVQQAMIIQETALVQQSQQHEQ